MSSTLTLESLGIKIASELALEVLAMAPLLLILLMVLIERMEVQASCSKLAIMRLVRWVIRLLEEDKFFYLAKVFVFIFSLTLTVGFGVCLKQELVRSL